MDWGNIGSAVSDAASGLFDSAAEYATDAFDWLSGNPEAANILGGVATGVAGYYAQKDEQDWKEKLYRQQRQDQMINPGTIEGYGSHVGKAKTGLLTNGMIAGGE